MIQEMTWVIKQKLRTAIEKLRLDLLGCRGLCDHPHEHFALVNRLEETQKQYQLDRFLTQLDKADLLVCDELGYLSFSRAGAELLFQVFADRYERASLLVTSNLPFSEWHQVFQGERMTAALLDRLTRRCHIFEMNGESYRFRESMKTKRAKSPRCPSRPKNEPSRAQHGQNQLLLRPKLSFCGRARPGKGLAAR